MWPFHKKQNTIWYFLAFALLVLFVFSNSLFFGFVWDDPLLLVGKQAYQSVNFEQLLFEPLNGVEYLPLRDLTYMLDYSIWGWNPMGFHLTNLILYIFNIWAVYAFTSSLYSSILQIESTSNNNSNVITIAIMTSALFAVLPIHSEVVSYIHCRNVLLSGLFFLLSINYFLKFIESNLRRHNVVSLALFTCALLSKATVIMLPLVLLVLLYFRPIQKRKDYISLVPFFALAIVFFFIFKFHAIQNDVGSEHLISTFGGNNVLPKISVMLQIPYFYLTKLIVPIGLSVEYTDDFSRELFTYSNLLVLSVLGLIFLVALKFKQKFAQGLFALLWFIVCLAPVSNIFLTNPVVADRYAYLSSYAFAFILAVGLSKLGKKTTLISAWIVFTLIMGAYSWLAFERNNVWRSQLTLTEDMVKPGSNQAKGFLNLGHYYLEKKQFSKAFESFQKSKEIAPAFSELEYHQARLALMENKPMEALTYIEKALEQAVNLKEAYLLNLRGQVHELQGDFALAIESYQGSLDSPYATKVTRESASGLLQRAKRQLAPSLEAKRKDMLAHPEDLNKKAQFAVMLQSTGFRQEAIDIYEELLVLGGPRWEIYYNLGSLYRGERRFQKSLQNFQLSLSLNNNSGMVHNELGLVYKETGQNDEATKNFLRAIELEPQSAKAQVNLARLYFRLGKKKEAREMFEQIRHSFPEHQAMAEGYLLRIPK